MLVGLNDLQYEFGESKFSFPYNLTLSALTLRFLKKQKTQRLIMWFLKSNEYVTF